MHPPHDRRRPPPPLVHAPSNRWGSSPEPERPSPTEGEPGRQSSRGRRPVRGRVSSEENQRIAQRRAEVVEAAHRSRRRRSVLLAVVAGVLFGGAALVLSPVGGVSRIDVVGATRTSDDAIRVATGVGRGRAMILVRTATVRRRLERLPWVARTRVARIMDGRHPVLRITVVERVAVAAVRVKNGTWLTVDATGRVLALTRTKPATLVAVTVGRIAATPVSARILATRIAPILEAVSPFGAVALTGDGLSALGVVFAGAVPGARDTPINGGVDAIVAGQQIAESAQRGVLIARRLPPSIVGATRASPIVVQVDGDRVRVLVPSLASAQRALASAGLSVASRPVAFDFGAVDVTNSDGSTSSGAEGGIDAVPPQVPSAATTDGSLASVERRVRALEILATSLDPRHTLIVDLSVPDSPVVTPV